MLKRIRRIRPSALFGGTKGAALVESVIKEAPIISIG